MHVCETSQHQVSLDSLWTLRKLRDDSSEQGSAVKSSVFDKDSLRAMPLGLGLQYASMTEREREQIARQYASAQAMPSSSTFTGRAGDALSSQASEHTHDMRTAPGRNVPERSTPNNHVSGSPVRDVSARETSIGDHGAVPRSLPVAPSESGQHDRSFSEAAQSSPFSPPAAFSPHAEQQHQQHQISLSQVDNDVLNCLPQDVREEVLRAIVASGERGGEREIGDTIAPGGAPQSGGRMSCSDGDRSEQRREGAGGGSHELRQGVKHSERRAIEQHQALVHSGATRERRVCDAGGGVGGIDGFEQDDSQRPELGEDQTEVDFVDLRSPASPTHSARSTEDHALNPGAREEGMRTRVFEFESSGVLRRVLRRWVGGEVASPSQWHLELLYR